MQKTFLMNGSLNTDFLTATSTFVIGMGSAMNLGGNHFHHNSSSTPEEADQIALESDWAVVGQDLRVALDQIKQERL